MKYNRDMRPLLLKFGVALVFSFAGLLYSKLRTRRMRRTNSSPRLPFPPPPSGDANKFDTDGRSDLKDDLRSIPAPLCSCDDASLTAHVFEESHLKFTNDDNVVELSPSSKFSGEEEELQLLPESNDIVPNEFESSSNNAGIGEKVDTAMASKVCTETEETEQEIINLRNMVKVLQEREKNLEIQLLEYYGLKEQETAMAELQNRLKISNMEAKLYTLKIESLQAKNQRLEAQVADHARVVEEFETARGKIKILKRKLKSDEDKKKELLSALKQSVANLQEQEQMATLNDADLQNKLRRLKELEDESAELKKAHSDLQEENSALARRLESTQMLASSFLEDPETEALQKANNRLRQENEELTKEVERLRVDCCADVEELVYLRWVNACLRYELRNSKPPPGKTNARNLSKSLSPKSEEKAKQLILEYANSEGFDDRGPSIADFDSDHYSQASDLTDSGEFDDIDADVSSATRIHTATKSKFFRRLKNLVLGKKDSHSQTSSADKRNTSFAGSRKNDSASTISFEDMVGTYSCDALSSHHNSSATATPLTGIGGSTGGQSTLITPKGFSRHSLDIQRLRNQHFEVIKDEESIRSSSDVGSSFGYKRMVLSEKSIIGLPLDNQLDLDEPDAREKLELINFAEVLRSARGTPKPRKSTSY